MGERKRVNKTVRPLTTLTNLTPAMVTGGMAINTLGRLPLGYYRGGIAFWDLDLAVNQPNVWAEQQHILGILDGREEDYDLQTLAIVAAETIGTNHDASLTVPAGEVWYLNGVRGLVPVTTTCSIEYNWYCDLWPDHNEDSPAVAWGQQFFAAAQNNGVGGGFNYDADFGEIAPLFAITDKVRLLRLPGGTVLRVRFTSRGAVAEALNCTFQLFGFIGKSLVLP